MDPLTIIAVVAALAGLYATYKNSKTAKDAANTPTNSDGYNAAANELSGGSMAFNSTQSQLQRQWTEQMWTKQNEYNLPVNQMARLRAAGLNPSLMYSNGVSGLVSANVGAGSEAVASPSSAVTQLMGQVPQLLSDFTDKTALTMSEIELNKSKLPLNQQLLLNYKETMEKIRAEARQAGVEADFLEQTLPSRVQAAIAKGRFEKEDMDAAREYAAKMRENAYDTVVQTLDNLKKDGLIKDEMYNKVKNEADILNEELKLKKYDSENYDVGYWLDHMQQPSDILVLLWRHPEVQSAIKSADGNLWKKLRKWFSGNFVTGEPIVREPYR